MAHFAKIGENGVVETVIVISNEDIIDENGDESEQIGQALCLRIAGSGNWVQTSYNGNFRYNYAFIGGHYDADAEAFYEPRPFDSWTLNTDTYRWEAPIQYPDDGAEYRWDEFTSNWQQI